MEIQCHGNGLYISARPLVASSEDCFWRPCQEICLAAKLMETVMNDTCDGRTSLFSGQHSYVIL
jgi:hypothetical protein